DAALVLGAEDPPDVRADDDLVAVDRVDREVPESLAAVVRGEAGPLGIAGPGGQAEGAAEERPRAAGLDLEEVGARVLRRDEPVDRARAGLVGGDAGGRAAGGGDPLEGGGAGHV